MDNFKSAVILAGGKSSRMEFDKQFLVVDEQRLIFSIAKNLERHFDEVIIVSNKKDEYVDCKYTVVSDELKDMGPLAGMSVGLKYSSSKFVYIVACDMPNTDDGYIEYLKEKIGQDIKFDRSHDIYLSKIDDSIELFNGFYQKNLSDDIKDYLIKGTKKSIISFYERCNKSVSYVSDCEFNKYKFKKDMFINLNTKEDLFNYEKIKQHE
ncbi:MAG: molybdenum cofactor guanylyltransferase [Romboutsia sp.]|uniref:molybdenum cofactor guanylyltransferase n=1 Tax=Romboutsia sp. TaxID=1965302 RepID=UPI003F2AD6D3